MDNERAIEVIKNYIGCYLGNLSDEEYEALELAIKALKDAERLEEENHENFVKSQHIISMLVEEIKELRGEEE